MRAFTLLLLLGLLLISEACNSVSSTTGAITLGSHNVSAQPSCISKQINNRFPNNEAIYNLKCGDTQVTIRNEELIVNGKSYGVLSKGDAVHVNNGVVLVNGKQIKGAAQR